MRQYAPNVRAATHAPAPTRMAFVALHLLPTAHPELVDAAARILAEHYAGRPGVLEAVAWCHQRARRWAEEWHALAQPGG
jgi:hypothetical protein